MTTQQEQNAEHEFRVAAEQARTEKTWTAITHAMTAWNNYCAVRDANRQARIAAPIPDPRQRPLVQIKRVLDSIRDQQMPKVAKRTKAPRSKSKKPNNFTALINALEKADSALTQYAAEVNTAVWDQTTDEMERTEMLGDISELRRNLPLLLHFLRSTQ